MNWLKIITRSGRQDIVRQLLRPYANIGEVSGIVTNGVSVALNYGTDKLTDARCAQISKGSTMLGSALTNLGKAVDPAGEDGKAVSVAERIEINSNINDGLALILDKEMIDAALEAIVAKVP